MKRGTDARFDNATLSSTISEPQYVHSSGSDHRSPLKSDVRQWHPDVATDTFGRAAGRITFSMNTLSAQGAGPTCLSRSHREL